MVVALPLPRRLFRAMGFETVSHLTALDALSGIVRREIGHRDHWARCDVELIATSGFDLTRNRLLRDYSVLDFELAEWGKERGKYTYFFAGEPSRWGIWKNIPAATRTSGYATVRIAVEDLLSLTDGPLFFRPDDFALVLRGGYRGPAWVSPRLI